MQSLTTPDSFIETPLELAITLLESVTTGVFSFDREWRYTFVNRAAERVLGYSRQELLGRACWEVFPQLRKHESGIRAETVMRGRQPATWEARSTITGLWNRWRMYPMSDGGVSAFVENIEDRVRAEGALRASELRFRTLAELVPAFVWTNDPSGHPEWRNQRWLAFSGLPEANARENADFDLIHPDDLPLTVEQLRRGWQDGRPLRFEHRLRRADGQYRWFLVLAQPIVDGAGVTLQWIGAAIDVQEQRDALAAERTAREEAEKARLIAEKSREHLRNLLAAIPTAIAVTRGHDHVYELVNPAYEALVGKRQVQGRAVAEVFPSIITSGLLSILRQVQQTGEASVIPERRVIYDREHDGVMYEGYFSSFMAPLTDEDGTATGVVTSTLEVTEHVHQRRRIEALRAETEAARAQLESAHDALEDRIAERTAELARSNTALAAEIAVRVQAEEAHRELQRRLARAREDERRRTARDLHDQVGQTLSALMLSIQTACDAERLPPAAAGRLADALRLAEDLGRDVHELATRLRPALLDDLGLHAALNQLVNDWSRRYQTPVDFQASWLQRERLAADVETVLYRVVQEALTNVARHAHAQRVSIVVERHDGHVIAIVEDDGVGFDVARSNQARLGLVGMKERVTLAGGSVEIESEANGGTSVIARLPVELPDVDEDAMGANPRRQTAAHRR